MARAPQGAIPRTHVVVDGQVLLGELPCPALGPCLRVLLRLMFAPPIQPALVVYEQLRIFFFCPFKVGQLRSYRKSPKVAVNNQGAGGQMQQQALMALPKFGARVQENPTGKPSVHHCLLLLPSLGDDMVGGEGRADMARLLPALVGGGYPWVVLASPAWGTCGKHVLAVSSAAGGGGEIVKPQQSNRSQGQQPPSALGVSDAHLLPGPSMAVS